MYSAEWVIDNLRYFKGLEGQNVRAISEDRLSAFLELKHEEYVIAAFPDARIILTDLGNYTLKQAEQAEKERQALEENERKQAILDEKKRRKAAHNGFIGKIWWIIFTPILAYVGNLIIDRILLVIPKITDVLKQFFQAFTS